MLLYLLRVPGPLWRTQVTAAHRIHFWQHACTLVSFILFPKQHHPLFLTYSLRLCRFKYGNNGDTAEQIPKGCVMCSKNQAHTYTYKHTPSQQHKKTGNHSCAQWDVYDRCKILHTHCSELSMTKRSYSAELSSLKYFCAEKVALIYSLKKGQSS